MVLGLEGGWFGLACLVTARDVCVASLQTLDSRQGRPPVGRAGVRSGPALSKHSGLHQAINVPAFTVKAKVFN